MTQKLVNKISYFTKIHRISSEVDTCEHKQD